MPADPTAVSGLRGRWRASTISSPPADGAALATWTDTAGSANATQGTGANQPTYRSSGSFLPNAVPVVEFTAASNTWMRAAVTDAGTTTKVVVFRPKTVSIQQALVTYDSGYEFWIDTSNLTILDVPNVASVNLTPLPTTIAANSWYVATFDSNGSNSHHSFINGAAEGTSTGSAVATGTSLDIGARGWNSGLRPFNGYIAEILDYSRVLQPWERVIVHSYVQEEYGITVTGYEATPTLESGPAVNVTKSNRRLG